MVDYIRERRRKYPMGEVYWFWRCPNCDKGFYKTTPQGLGMARENHMRKHRKKRNRIGTPPQSMLGFPRK